MQVFHASFQAIQWVVLAYLLAITTLVVSVGRLGNLFGRRRLTLAGIAAFTVSSVACGAAQELWQLIAARAAQGLSAAVMMALALALVGDVVPKERVGSAMGFLGTMSAVGTALGPPLGGVLIATLGWQAIFLVNVPLGFVAYGLAGRYLPASAAHGNRPSFDYGGSLLLSLTLAAYALTMTLGRGAFGAVNGVVTSVAAGQRGVVSGLLNLSRILGLITGASAMGAVFSAAVGTGNIGSAGADAIASATRSTFAVAAVLIAVALGLAMRSSGATKGSES